MRKITLYSAMSLDGYIARPDGNIDWLTSFPNPDHTDYGYADFLAGIDTTLMGNATYRQVMGFDIPFPYPDKINYVFSRNSEHKTATFVEFISGDIVDFVRRLRERRGGHIWLIGGGQINGEMVAHDLIDEMILHIIPVVLGDGIRLFKPGADLAKTFRLETSLPYTSGIMELKYRRIEDADAPTNPGALPLSQPASDEPA